MSELRLHFGPGYRIYYGQVGDEVILLLAGGAKSTQQRDIQRAPEAVTATAHKLARIIYAMLRDQNEYQDPGQGYDEKQARQRAIKNLRRKANQLGLQLIEVAAS